jgi:hypothetical protein
MATIHHNLSQGAWYKLSLIKQLANIGSEVSRAKKWCGKNEQYFNHAVERGLELIDLTLSDQRHKNRLKEIARARELFVDATSAQPEYHTSLDDLDRYFLAFARAVRV